MSSPTSVREQKRRTNAASTLAHAAGILRIYGFSAAFTADQLDELADKIHTGKVVAP